MRFNAVKPCWIAASSSPMQKKKPIPLSIALLISLTGCATLDTFKEMPPEQRATLVCERQAHIIASKREKKALEASIEESRQALGRGYRVHRQCQQVKVYGDLTVKCSTTGNKTTCREHRPEKYEEQCTETPVVINPDLVRSNISEWTAALRGVTKKYDDDWGKCYQRFYVMPAEEAYKYY